MLREGTQLGQSHHFVDGGAFEKTYSCLSCRKGNWYYAVVFDNVNILARDDPVRLRGFQELAKLAADKGLFKVVFVCSDGVAPFKMEIPFLVAKFN